MMKPQCTARVPFFTLQQCVRRCLPLAFALFCLCWLPIRSLAFDTGHHADLTRSALSDFGFSTDATDVVVINNWLVDFYSAPPDVGFESNASLLHCDNLFDTNQVRNYLGRLTINTRTWTQDATRRNDVLAFLTFLGESLHTIQDFYTHSNWVETHPQRGGKYRVTTWFDCPPADTDPAIFTGFYANPHVSAKPPGAVDHGDYVTGLNHDAYGRPRWDQAYVFAYVATRNWVNTLHGWADEIDPTFWARAQSYSLNAGDRTALDFDLLASYRISEWIGDWQAYDAALLVGRVLINGHWKGVGSGNILRFPVLYTDWTSSDDSVFVKKFKNNFGLLAFGLENNSPSTRPIPTVAASPLNARVISLRTLRAARTDTGIISRDFYAEITIGGQHFIEATQMGRNDVSPAWNSLRFVPNTPGAVHNVTYLLWDESIADAAPPYTRNDTFTPIQPSQAALNFTYTPGTQVCAGDITGVHNSAASAVSTAYVCGGLDLTCIGGLVNFFITDTLLEMPAVEVTDGITFTRTGLTWNRATNIYSGVIAVTNTSNAPISGPLTVLLTGLTPGYTLVNRAGACYDGPYALANIGMLAPGATVNVPVQFTRTANVVVDYRLRVYSGQF